MSDLRQAAQQALEALESVNYANYSWACVEAVTALKAALEQPEQDGSLIDEGSRQQEPVAWMVYTLDGKSVCVTDNPADFADGHRALPLYTHPPRNEQPEQEPVACPHRDEPRGCYRVRCQLGRKCVEPLYTHPPRREWRGLTEEAVIELLHSCDWRRMHLAVLVRAIEAALKERNNG